MTVKSDNLDHWRDYFRRSNSDIFDIIENAIMVAALDCPKALKLRRDQIAEKLFSCLMYGYFDRDSVEDSNPNDDEEEEEEGDGRKKGFDTELGRGGSKESKVNSGRDYNGEYQMNQTSNYSNGEAEALTDEIEEENLIFEEVLKLKEIIDNYQDETDSIVFDSLRKLEQMNLAVDILKATKIGKSVNAIRKHSNKQIQNLARKLIQIWKEMVEEWVKITTDLVAEATPESCNPTVVNEMGEEEEEEGLPSPPLDDLAFIDTHTTSMELSKFFDGMDDDGNPQINSQQFNKNINTTRKPLKETKTVPNQHKERLKKEEAMKQRPSPTKESEPMRMAKQAELNFEPKMQTKIEKHKVNLEDAAKLEAAKRKLHENYQQAENAKRQRTIQVMEIKDLPKQGLRHRNAYTKPGNNIYRNRKNDIRR